MNNNAKGILWLLTPLIFLAGRYVLAVLYFPVNGVVSLLTSYSFSIDYVNTFLIVTDYINIALIIVGLIMGVYYLRKKPIKKNNKI